ncbi:MAG TPA: hypothetical protein DDY98_00270 [Ruminococcaceae bacterium]|nr:hypothetical protein [Oscillospiraceae bacterium]
MKNTVKILSILLAALLLCSVVPLSASAKADSGSFSMLNYNVAGLPDFGAMFNGTEKMDVATKEKVIGETLNATGIDFIAVQEDFNFNRYLVKAMPNYTYRTVHHGGVPFGSGLNIYSTHKLYNVEREEWRTRYGLFDEGDELTPKGILHATIEIADGVYADFYDIHADAYDTEESRKARIDNFNQLAEMIARRSGDRPVIITGDFNISVHHSGWDPSGAHLKELFIDKLGMKDAWIETKNGGSYTDFSRWTQSGVGYWGNWDSVEKFLYKDGNGIHLDATDFEYVCYKDSDGNALSDHNAAKVVFKYTLGENFRAESASSFQVEKRQPIKRFFEKTQTFFKTLFLCLKNIALLKVQKPLMGQ